MELILICMAILVMFMAVAFAEKAKEVSKYLSKDKTFTLLTTTKEDESKMTTLKNTVTVLSIALLLIYLTK